MTASFFKGRRVFVTGHTGFKGSWLSMWLTALGAEVWGYALPAETDPSLFGSSRLHDRIHSRYGDIRDRAALDAAVREANPSIVFHLAAQPLVRRSHMRPVETFETNVMGTVNLLESLRTAPGVEAAVIVTTDKCYANDESDRALREDDALGGSDPYSASKACAELVSSAYRDSFFAGSACRVATARAGNVIGGGDWSEDRIVPDIVSALQSGRQIELRNPSSTRPWQHVLDPLYGYLLLAQELVERDGCGAWNFGPPHENDVSVRQLTETFVELWGNGAWRANHDGGPREHRYLRLDSSKAAGALGFQTKLSFAQACAWTVSWYRSFIAGEDAGALCQQQIQTYASLA